MVEMNRVLVCDDERKIRETYYDYLTAKGFEVVLASNGREAVDKAGEECFDIIVLDVMMPEMDGYQALKIIHSSEKYPKVPVIAVTAQAMSGDRERCIEAGATDYIAKPIDVDILMNILRKYM